MSVRASRPVRILANARVRQGLIVLSAFPLGIALALAFPPRGWWLLAFPVIAVLTWLQFRRGLLFGALTGFLFGLGFFGTLLPWLDAVGSGAWPALTVFCSLWLALPGVLTALVTRQRGWFVWVPAAWVLVESLRDRIPWGGFSWGRLAFSQADSPLAFVSRLGGMPLVTFVVALIGCLLLALVRAAVRRPLDALAPVIAIAILVLLAFGARVYAPAPQGTAVVAVVQGGTPQLGLGAMDVRRAVLDNHVSATKDLAAQVTRGDVAQPQLVIWPENSSDLDPFTDASVAQEISGAASAIKAPILVGAVLVVPDQPNALWNAGIVWDPLTGPGERYIKVHPVPFGEYLPLRDLLAPRIDAFDRIARDFLPGDAPGLLEMAGVRIGNAICFEVAYDDVMNDLMDGGAQLLTVQTNNATFGERGQPQQQYAIERLRAIQGAIPLAVASTTGISGLIAADGTSIARMDEGSTGSLVATVSLADGTTVGAHLHSWPELVLSITALAAAVWSVAGARRRERRVGK